MEFNPFTQYRTGEIYDCKLIKKLKRGWIRVRTPDKFTVNLPGEDARLIEHDDGIVWIEGEILRRHCVRQKRASLNYCNVSTDRKKKFAQATIKQGSKTHNLATLLRSLSDKRQLNGAGRIHRANSEGPGINAIQQFHATLR